jgi:peptide/nickel transport system substrate-binding protein
LARAEPDGPSLLYWDGAVDVRYLPTGLPPGEGPEAWRDSGETARETARIIPGDHYLVTDTATHVGTFVSFNQQKAPGPDGGGLTAPRSSWFNDLRFRRAISHLIPRERIVAELLDGYGTPAYGRIASWGPADIDRPDLREPAYDPGAASRLLDEMGLVDRDGDGVREDTDGVPVSFTVITNEPNNHRVELANLLAAEWNAAGMHVTARPDEWQAVLGELFGATYECLVLGLTGSDSWAEGWNIWASDGDLHFWDLNQPKPVRAWEAELDELHERWLTTLSADGLAEIERAVQAVVSEQLPLLSVARWYDYILMRRPYRNLRMFGANRSLWPLEYVFLDG